MVFDDQRALGVGIDREGMNLDPTGVRLTRNQAHMQFLHAMAADGNAMLFCEGRHPKPAGDAAAIRTVWLDVSKLRVSKSVFKFVDGVEVFAHGEWHARQLGDLAVAQIIVGDCWLLEPNEIEGLECFGSNDRLIHAERVIGIDHEGDIRSDELSNGFDALDVFSKIGFSDLDLDRIETLIEIALDAGSFSSEKFRSIPPR